MSSNTSYEQPLNERMRTFLRLEQLMQRFRYCLVGDSAWATHCALTTLIEIFSLSTRGDLKSELMKEMDRQMSNLVRLQSDPDVDQTRLESVIDRQRGLFNKLHGMSGQLGQHLKNNDFINSIRQRTSIPGGTCDFDLPAYHYWLSRPLEARREQLADWIRPFEQVQEAVDMILKLVRESTTPEKTLARAGFYQQGLELGQPYQMIRIDLPDDCPYYPEISAGKHRFSVRFLLQGDLDSRPKQTQEDIEFKLACCAL